MSGLQTISSCFATQSIIQNGLPAISGRCNGGIRIVTLLILIFLAVAALLIHVMWIDFFTLKIKNISVFVLYLLYIPFYAFAGSEDVFGDVFSGILLFTIALVLWSLRMLGAGDVKLFGALGPFVGFDNLVVFVLGLLLFSVVFLLTLAMATRVEARGKFVDRLREIKKSRRVPYGVIMCLSAFPAIAIRFGQSV